MIAPKLRFSEFKDEWIEKKIGNLINIKSGLGFKADEYVTEKEIPLLQIENVGYGSIKWGNNVKYVPTEYLKKHENLALKINDIVLALNRPVTNDQLKISKLTSKDIPSILYQRVGKIETKDLNIDSSFIFQYFQIYLKDYIVKSSLGSDQPFISILDLYAQKIEIPQIQEQTKIAEFLSAVDDKISQLSRQLELLKQYKKGVMHKIFSQEIRFKNDNGEDFGDWDEKELGEVGTTFSGGTPASKNKEYYQGNIPFIKSGEISAEFTEQFVNELALKNSSAKLVNKGDLLYALYGATSGQVAISKLAGAINQAVLCIRSNLSTYFLYSFLSYSKDEIISTYLQGGQGNLSAQILKKIIVPIPTIQEQEKIAEFLTAIDERIDHTTAQLTRTKQWKKGLLQQMFV